MFQRRTGPLGIACLAAVLLAAGFCEKGIAGEWPTYQHDPSRSAVTNDGLSFPLVVRWVYRPSQPPSPAWPEPGKELHRMDFDYAPQPVISDGLVIFASSADDTVRALELATGQRVWQFTADGPIRFAPSIAHGKVTMAADDGWVYCLEAKTGAVVWRFRGPGGDDQVIGNGRMISRWPCRTGALVVDDVVYATAGMWPSEGVYVYALDAETGNVLWSNDTSGEIYLHTPHPGATSFSGVAPQGYLLVSGDTLLVPTGRCVPAAFDRRTGRLLYYKPAEALYHGGSWLTAADGLYFNSKNHFQNPSEAFIGEAQPRSGDGMFAYSFATGESELTLAGAYRVLASGGTLYTVSAQDIQAIDLNRLRNKTAGGAAKGKPASKKGAGPAKNPPWTTPHAARVYCLALAGKALLVGEAGGIAALDAATGKQVWSEKVEGEVRGLAVSDGRLVAATDRGMVLSFEHGTAPGTVRRNGAKTLSVVVPDEQKKAAEEILKSSGKWEGYALVIGEPDSRLAEALAAVTRLRILSILPQTAPVAAERERLLNEGLYGSRVAVLGLDDLAHLPFSPYFADLVVVSGKVKGISPEECYRVLRPCGGVMCFAGISEARKPSFGPPGEWSEERGTVVRGPLPGAGEWRYPWADGGRSGVGNESLVRLPLQVLWFGGPGPDRLMDRHWMGSPPLAAGGRVFMVGQHHVLAFDAYNGRELWSRRLEDAGRKYSQYYSENFVADDESVYVATHDRCHRFDQATGEPTFVYRIPDSVVRQTPPAVVPEYLDVEWPTAWQVFGPFGKGKHRVAAGDLASIPDRMTVQGQQYRATTLKAVGGILDFEALDKAASSPKSGIAERVVYAFAKIQCPKAGKLLIRAGADAPMQWHVDGKRVFDSSQDQGRAPRVASSQYVFDADVSTKRAGEHVLAVVVELGRAARLTSTSLGASAKDAMPLVTGNENVPNLESLVWGYVSVTDDLVLGSYAVPIAEGQPDESQLVCRSESKALFALDKKDGSLRWVYRPRPDRTISNIEIAFGDGRLFLLDATSKADSVRAARRGEKIDIRLTLVALDLATGRELWRQADVPVLPDRSTPTRLKSNPSHLFMGLPNWGHLVYAKGVVVLGANAAYDAATGKKIWEQNVRPQKLPIVLGDWLLAQPNAYDLHTGQQRTTKDLLTGREIPWSFRRAYGCGPVSGCQNVLFGRSGADGLVDVATQGTANFGGVRPGCTRSITAACGLLVHPEGYSGCCCSYNYQTSLAMISAQQSSDAWYVLPRHSSVGPIRKIAVNLGAPGDRIAGSGTAWLGFPRPISNDACPAPVTVSMENASCYYRRSATAEIRGDAPWVYSSGLRGHGQIAIDTALEPDLEIPTCRTAPQLDGAVDDACWKEAASAPFENGPFTLLGANVELRLAKDARNLYFGYHRKALPNACSHVDEDTLRKSDAFEIYLTDRTEHRGLHVGLTRGEKTFAQLGTVDRYRKVDPTWEGQWQWAIRRSADQWTAEVAIPLELLAKSGIDPQRLRVNCMSRNLTQSGLEAVFLTDPHYGADFKRCTAFRTVGYRPSRPSSPAKRSFTVRLHFAEIDQVDPGQRVFDVAIQGKTVLKDLDIVREAGGTNRPLVKAFSGIQPGASIVIELVPSVERHHEETAQQEPIISGVEIVEEGFANGD